MMTYDLLGAKMILEKTNQVTIKPLIPILKNSSFLYKILPFLNFKIDLTGKADWDLDS